MVRAPGRVNLIGDHTDYNDGFVLPMAIPYDTVIAMSPAPEGAGSRGASEVDSEGFGRAVIPAVGSPDGSEPAPPGWIGHVAGVRDLLAAEGIDAPPWRAAIASDVPLGAGLSSSAALEIAVGLALLRLAGSTMSRPALARLGQRVENDLLGLPSGIMDQLISATAVSGHASLIDCRSLETRPVPLPTDAVVVVLDTGTRRRLVDSAFAQRRDSCRRACELLGVASLREVGDVHDVDAAADPYADPTDLRRARHVVSENARTLAAAAALEAGNSAEFGALMTQSHQSLRDDYEVSGPALDAIVEIAAAEHGCLGARMTGGGFAGCAVSLVVADAVPAFVDQVARRYQETTGETARVLPCAPAAGAEVVLDR